MPDSTEMIEEILDHLLAGGDAPPHADSNDPLVRKLHAVVRDRLVRLDGTRAFSYLSTISHELRTPLNAIIGYSELLLEDEEAYEPRAMRADVNRIHNAGRHLLGLINEVIEVANIESGRVQLTRRRVSVEPLIQELLPTLMPAVRRRGNRFSWFVDPNLRASTDHAKLRTVLRTLVNRAARVTTEGEISLRATRSGDDKVCIEVTDTGERVSAEDLARTFHPFATGSGAGLTSTARLIELIGGRLEVEALPQGSAFRVVLPADLDDGEDDQPIPVVPPGTAVILLVIGVDEVREQVEQVLRGLDCVVMATDSGQEATRLAELLDPAVIVLDAGVDSSGWDTLGTLKSHSELARIPVVMLSGDENDPMVGAADYLAKPFDRQTMIDTVSRLIAKGSRKRILVVDDEADARELARRVLTSVGYLVDEVADGKDAMAYLERERPDLILLDLMMPEMDGFEVLQALKSDDALAPIPVVVLTAMTLTDADRQLLQSRAQSVVTKGTAPSRLIDRIAGVLERS